MSKKPKNWSSVKKRIKEWIKKNNALDVILFGSYARNKPDFRDIDLCIIIKKEDEKKAIDLVDSFSNSLDKLGYDFHITILTEEDFIQGKNALVHTLITEGFSIKNNANMAEIYNLFQKSIFIYSLRKFKGSKRTRFHYLLRGRNGTKGTLDRLQGQILGNSVISLPTQNEDVFKEILDAWEVKYKIIRGLMNVNNINQIR